MPLFDIKCLDCGTEDQIIALVAQDYLVHSKLDLDKAKCPNCGSAHIERKWTVNSIVFIMKGDIQGETPGARKYAEELTRKGAEKWSK